MVENLAKLCSRVLWNMELVSGELELKQSVIVKAWFLFAAYSKIQEERCKLKKELLSKKEPKLEDLENCQPMYIVKK